MGNIEHIEIIKQGISVWNNWREENPQVIPDLSFANLSGLDLGAHTPSTYPINLRNVNLRGADLSGVDLEYGYLTTSNLSGSILRNAHLRVVRLDGADLSNSDLSHSNFDSEYDVDLSGITELGSTNLTNANFSHSSLRDVELGNSNLTRATFYRTNLRLSSFSGATFSETVIIDSDLSGAHGFERCIHLGSSYIDRVSIVKSGGLPVNFLRGFGIDESILEQDNFLISKESKYYSSFISYSSTDEVFARSLRAYLQDNGARCWFAPEDMKIGAKIRTTIDVEIEKHDKALLVLSAKSISSQWVEQEVEKALEKERILKNEMGKDELVLFPIRIDNSVFETNAGWVNLLKNTRNIGDFTNWKDPIIYERSISRLLKDLKRYNGQ